MTNVLNALKILWNTREEIIAEKIKLFQLYKRKLGEEQENQREINELLKENAE